MGTTLFLIPPSCPTSFNTSKKKGKASQKQLLQDNLSWEKNPQKWSCRLCRRPDKWMGTTVRRKRPKSPKHCVVPWEPADFVDVSAHLFQKDYFTNCTCIVLLLCLQNMLPLHCSLPPLNLALSSTLNLCKQIHHKHLLKLPRGCFCAEKPVCYRNISLDEHCEHLHTVQ